MVFRFGLELRDDFDVPSSGPERVGDHGSRDAGPTRPGILARAGRAMDLYETFAAHRPPGWPQSGAGALCALASQGRAATLEGEVARLLVLAKDMRATARHADAERLARAQRRAERRARGYGYRIAPGQLQFRFNEERRQRPRWESPELRRRRVRDELLRRGEHPGLSPHVFTEAWQAVERHEAGKPTWGDPDSYRLPDGMTDRAQRYAREIADGQWTLPDWWADDEDLQR